MKDCFIVSPIGDVGSETRKRSDQVLKHIIQPILNEFDIKSVRADKLPMPGVITNHIIERIINSDLVIADLTDRNPNVYYELAIRHVLKKPFVQLIEDAEELPFDVAGIRTIRLNLKDPDLMDESRNELRQQVKHLIDNPDSIDSPVSHSIELSYLRRSEKPQENLVASFIDAINELKYDINQRITKLDFQVRSTQHHVGILKSKLNDAGLDDFAKVAEKNVNKVINMVNKMNSVFDKNLVLSKEIEIAFLKALNKIENK
jgi:hypothetical protein